MQDHPIKYVCYALALLIGIGIGVALTTPAPLSFEERWSPVIQIDGGIKGDKLDLPKRPVPALLPMRSRIRVACVSFCDYP